MRLGPVEAVAMERDSGLSRWSMAGQSLPPPLMTPALLVLYNPVSGDRSAESFFKDSVLPLLAQHEILHEDVVATTSPGHAGAVVIDFVEAHDGNVTILLGSGDGTLHEIINHLSSAELKGSRASAQIHFVLVPCGTGMSVV